jgi:uncharacterized protein Smg (DUF494 family)
MAITTIIFVQFITIIIYITYEYMNQNFDKETTDFIQAYYNETGFSSDEMKKIFHMEEATDQELMAEFTDYEIQMGQDEYDELHELINALLYFKSIDDSLQYLQKLEVLKEFNNESFSKTILKKYLDFEKKLFIK